MQSTIYNSLCTFILKLTRLKKIDPDGKSLKNGLLDINEIPIKIQISQTQTFLI